MKKTINKMVGYIKESYAELHKVSWPSKEIVQKHTILVISISLFVALFSAFSDAILSRMIELAI